MATDDEAAPKLNPVPPLPSEPVEAEPVRKSAAAPARGAGLPGPAGAVSEDRRSGVTEPQPERKEPAEKQIKESAEKQIKEPAEKQVKEPAEKQLNERLTERIRHGTQPPVASSSAPAARPSAVAPPRGPISEREDKLNETIRQRLEHLVPELVKKTFAAGMGAVFSTEEGIRKIAREVSLPDVVGYVASSADGAKDKVFEAGMANLTQDQASCLVHVGIKDLVNILPVDSNLFGMAIGGGVIGQLTTRTSLRADVRHIRSISGGGDVPDLFETSLSYWRATVGVALLGRLF